MTFTPDNPVLPTHPLELSEILGQIFEQLKNKDNASTLLVSRRWYQVCEGIFWRHLESISDFERMLVLLGEVADIYVGPGDNASPYFRLNLNRYPIHKKWVNFEKHSAFVHSIHLPRLEPYIRACNLIALNRPPRRLFPNLRTLTYTNGADENEFGIEYLSLFMEETVLHFCVRLPSMDAGYRSIQAIESISTMTNLRYLEVTCRNLIKEVVEALSGVLGDLLKLEVLVLPPYRAVGTIINQLATHGRIKEIRSKDIQSKAVHAFDYSFWRPRVLRSSDVEEPSIGHDAFGTLTLLTFSADAEGVKKLLLNGGERFPSTIRSLHVEMAKKESAQDLNSLFHVVRARCPSLVDFRYSDTSEASIPFGSADAIRWSGLDFETIRPILFHSLVSLHITHHAPLQWSADHLRTLASSLPLVESLTLNHCPMENPAKPSPPIQSLSSFAKGCLNLKYLAIYVDASVPFTLQDSDRQPFRELATLNFGWSQITRESSEDVAVMLAQLLPATCAIISEQGPRFILQAGPLSDLWENVIRNRNMLLRMRKRVDRFMIIRGMQTEG
ncbi:hypothetical protein Hypma_010463 [Hypsizygus marmoreus]|uniref:F-box domain-containing protein n=1 Tax=Hypsizygus marmoreus TaxID=39966 RepID=A0A369JJK3_HYPMA|nr:hypothetical protein Hypma_010463 [Hypsizygus marmoreus]